jgi:hypothetical protein
VGLRGKNKKAILLQITRIDDLKQKIGRNEPLNDEEKAFVKAVSTWLQIKSVSSLTSAGCADTTYDRLEEVLKCNDRI